MLKIREYAGYFPGFFFIMLRCQSCNWVLIDPTNTKPLLNILFWALNVIFTELMQVCIYLLD